MITAAQEKEMLSGVTPKRVRFLDTGQGFDVEYKRIFCDELHYAVRLGGNTALILAKSCEIIE